LAKTFRRVNRFARLNAFLARAMCEGMVYRALPGRKFDQAAKSRWLQVLCRRASRLLQIEVGAEGRPPTGGLLVSNHLGYLDIIVLGSLRPMTFLSKSDVKNWPVIGAITTMSGALYIEREHAKDVVRVAKQFEEVVDSGGVVGLFPEGTSSDGSGVLPFKSALLDPAIRGGWPVTPVWIGYALDDGSVADEVSYWRDMTFFPHLLNLLSKKTIRATVRYGSPTSPGTCRKELARSLHAEVCRLGKLRVDSRRLKPRGNAQWIE
jgi:1-acyl-sn-glycerol-3-phosphate acyltransferase